VADSERRSALERHYERGTFGAGGADGPALVLRERRGLAMAQVNGAPADAGPATLGSLIDGDATLLWTGPGQWFAVSDALGAGELLAALAQRLSATDATITDLSHARTVVRVSGTAWRDLLAKGSPADIDAMGSGDCAATLLSHFTVIIHCLSDDSADVYVFRSFGASLWEWLCAGAAEFGYAVQEPQSP
jgi:heterotetrameric sarcosine oxidase gamma subunit